MNSDTQNHKGFDLCCLQQGRHYDPFVLLGCHPLDEQWEVRVWLPCAKTARLIDGPRLRRSAKSSLFTAQLSAQEKEALPYHYKVEWRDEQGEVHCSVCPYTFEPQIGELDLYLFAEGRHWNLYDILGAHVRLIDGIEGVQFAVWAPSAERVAVVGDFNSWNGQCHPMRSRGRSGVWELFIPGVHVNERYKFDIRTMHDGFCVLKADPYAQSMEMRPRTASIICQSAHQWQDDDWLAARRHFDWQHAPILIYEVHLGSWQRDENCRFLNYREIAHRLVEYVLWMGYNYINLMPVSEHPLDESWGYQTSGYYAPTRRFGDPDDFRYFVDYCHQHHIGVYLDWVPAHFPKDSFALARFDGTALYEHEDPRLGEHSEWGTYIFNYGRNEVRNFLIANALYWVREFHLDGLRVDAVASMLYLDYGRNDGDWLANEHGGNENLAAVEFIKTLNTEVHGQFPGVVLMAEESTSWPMVSRPTWMGGLGFSMKWNMGWMNDTLAYFSRDALYRSHHHHQLTFSQVYAYSENFILPLSHDEVVHLKRSLVSKMPGDHWQQLANVRLLLAYQMMNPGKKLLFMGGEFGQWEEWNDAMPLDWTLCEHPQHQALQQFVRQLNQLYFGEKALHCYDFESQGFEWIDCNDSEKSTLSFIRQAGDEQLICVFNFTPVVRGEYRIGLPRAGRYVVRLNSDRMIYGGSDACSDEPITAVDHPYIGQGASALITLPPLGMLVLQWEY
ncbi:MAG: 1,4-alpha-glucan branching enzyme [Desulfuromonadales bacterium C00003068]|nr:MAG: 1,4-alpha-glucan branching enzyme [Desulfuromonadales bacterium C00003068]